MVSEYSADKRPVREGGKLNFKGKRQEEEVGGGDN